LESKLLRPDRLSVITKMFSWPVGSKDEGAAPEIDSQIDPDITPDITLDITLEYQPRDRPMIPESARAEFLADHDRVPEKSRGLAKCARRFLRCKEMCRIPRMKILTTLLLVAVVALGFQLYRQRSIIREQQNRPLRATSTHHRKLKSKGRAT